MTTITVLGEAVARDTEILTPEALEFIAALHDRFASTRNELLEGRVARREQVARTGSLDFLAETEHVRGGDWTVACAPADLVDRRVEITGPTEPKMAINALNSGAEVWLADLEDANTPHWSNVIGGQLVLKDAVRRTLAFTSADGRHYELNSDTPLAAIVVRPRGWHLDDDNLVVSGGPAIAALVDFGLYFFHNSAELLRRGSGPYFYLPKMESHLEARLWNDIFVFAQEALAVPQGSVRATVLIETIPAAFEMDEILYELRDHASGLNAGRWDYLFSMIKCFRDSGPDFVFPDRNSVTMDAPMMRAYARLLVRTCHRRGAFAIGGMAAFIPSRRDAAVNEMAFAKVRADKQREAADGFDGSWVAHPDLVSICRDVFDAVLGDESNQLDVAVTTDPIVAADLLDVKSTPGSVTEAGARNNVSVAVQYLASWLAGHGAVAVNNLMEDAATAEIARSQIWQWIRNGVRFQDTGDTITRALVRRLLDEEIARVKELSGDAFDAARVAAARAVFEQVALADDYQDFLTVVAYRTLGQHTPES